MNINKTSVKLARSAKIAMASLLLSILVGLIFLIDTTPVLAHHPSGGEIPSTFLAGFLSGLGHPVIGIDHLVFTIAVGLLAALSKRLGIIIPAAFVVATAIGTAIHLQSIDLPIVELIISASILMAGIFLARRKPSSLALLTVTSTIAGIFHGYAYGESIVGAETTALGAYLLGFCIIQLAIGIAAYYIGKKASGNSATPNTLPIRFAGFAICGIGFSFLSGAILG
ncbi:MAG: HupE/UreJ family protein [Cyanobacteria bacterium P01_G01_bin.19]